MSGVSLVILFVPIALCCLAIILMYAENTERERRHVLELATLHAALRELALSADRQAEELDRLRTVTREAFEKAAGDDFRDDDE